MQVLKDLLADGIDVLIYAGQMKTEWLRSWSFRVPEKYMKLPFGHLL